MAQLIDLPEYLLQEETEELNISHKGLISLTGIEKFRNLKKLYCSNNQITSLNSLPSGLQVLNCSDNQITYLNSLPSGLQEFYCSHNQITSLDFLPSGLQILYCSDNPLSQRYIDKTLTEIKDINNKRNLQAKKVYKIWKRYWYEQKDKNGENRYIKSLRGKNSLIL